MASGNANWAPGVEAALPSGAVQNPYSLSVPSVSCASPGGCVAVGEFLDKNAHFQGLVLVQSAGRWGVGKAANLPTNAAADPNAALSGVSCRSPGNCSAVGTYRDGSVHTQGLLLSESAGVWSTGVEAKLPSNAGPDPVVSLAAVSCGSSGNCAAVGSYLDSMGHRQGLLLDESSGTWGTGLEVGLPGTPAPDPSVAVSSVSCAAPRDCTAVGSFQDSSMHYQGLLLTESSGVWGTGVEAAPPTDVGSNPGVIVSSASCWSPGNCAAVGRYLDGSSNSRGLLLSESSGTWAPGTETRLPSSVGSNPNASLNSVSCPAARSCVAVGGYEDSSSHAQGLLLTQTNGAWATGVEASPPANHAGNPSVSLSSVSCASAGSCSAVGDYADSAMRQQGLLLTQSASKWAVGVQAGVPNNAAPNPGVALESVSCPSAGNCAASGIYHDTSGAEQGLLVGATPASPKLTLRAPRKGTAGTQIAPGSVQAVLSGGAHPTGTITFMVFGPRQTAPTTCAAGGTVVGTASASGDGGYRPSAGLTPKRVGRYWWLARYGGDAGDHPAASSCGKAMAETVVAAGRVKITSVKLNRKHRSARFNFSAAGASGFRCALFRSKPGHRARTPHFTSCRSPRTYRHLRNAKYVFEVRAVSAAGPGPTARHRFKI